MAVVAALLVLLAVDAVQGVGLLQSVQAVIGGRKQKEQDEWFKSSESCNGTKQSPINVQCSDMSDGGDLKPLVLENYDKVVDGVVMVNDGHTGKGIRYAGCIPAFSSQKYGTTSNFSQSYPTTISWTPSPQ